MEQKARLEMIRRPGKLELCKEDDSLLNWKLLVSMQFGTQGDAKPCPKPRASDSFTHVRVEDREMLQKSQKGKAERKEKRQIIMLGATKDTPIGPTEGYRTCAADRINERHNRPLWIDESFAFGDTQRGLSDQKTHLLSLVFVQKRKRSIATSSLFQYWVDNSDSDESKSRSTDTLQKQKSDSLLKVQRRKIHEALRPPAKRLINDSNCTRRRGQAQPSQPQISSSSGPLYASPDLASRNGNEHRSSQANAVKGSQKANSLDTLISSNGLNNRPESQGCLFNIHPKSFSKSANSFHGRL